MPRGNQAMRLPGGSSALPGIGRAKRANGPGEQQARRLAGAEQIKAGQVAIGIAPTNKPMPS